VAIGVVAASLIGALLGGLAGMRYHRRVDRAGTGSLINAGLRGSSARAPETRGLPLITAGAVAC
jgi:hypothetical protein